MPISTWQDANSDSPHRASRKRIIENVLATDYDGRALVNGTETTCCGGEIFYWAPGHSVRVLDDAEVILFSPSHEHSEVLDHMLAVMAPA